MGLWDSWLLAVGLVSALFLVMHLNTPGWLDQQIAEGRRYAQSRYATGGYYY